jgi:undecaprenyl-diphosphatase
LTLREIWPFATRPALWQSVAEIFQRHGGKGVILSRFLPGVRAVTPIAAGALGMRIPFFVVTSIVAALVWALVYILPAAVLGQLLSTAGQISARLVGAVLTVIIALVLVVWLARFAAAIAGPRIYRGYRNLVSRMELSSNPLARRFGGLLDPALATIGPHLFWGTILLVSAIGLFAIVEGIIASAAFVDIDGSIRTFARALRSAPVDFVMVCLTAFGEGWVIAISAATLALALLVGGARLTAAIVALVFAATFVFVPVINGLLTEDYPVGGLHPALLAASFPSSHATLITLYCGVVAALATPALGTVGRMVVWSLALAIATLVGLSRIYLDALWPTDVAGGLLLGLALTAVFAMIRTGFESELGKSLRYPILACLVFLALGGTRAALYYEVDLARYAPRVETVTFAEAYWLDDGWRELPLRRLDLLGDSEETISLQVAADPAILTSVLAAAGWEKAPPFETRDLFLFLSPAAPLSKLPPLPLMESGRLPLHTFVRAGLDDDSRLVVRLWRTSIAVNFRDDNHPLLVGSITTEQVMRPYEALTMLDTNAASDAIDVLLGHIMRNAGRQLSVLQRRGPAGPVLLITPYRGQAAIGLATSRSRIALLTEGRPENVRRERNGYRPSPRKSFAIEQFDD